MNNILLKNKKRLWLIPMVYLTCLIIAFLPLGISLATGTFANILDCTLHEGFANPCLIFGADLGETFYTLGVLGWFSMLTMPVGLLIAAGWSVFLIVEGIIALFNKG